MKKLLLLPLFLLGAALPARAELTSKFDVNVYGFVKTDFLYADHGTGSNEYRVYTSGGRKDRSFRASARASRFGIDISSGSRVTAKIEADFLGLTDSLAGAAGSTADMRLRHAYIAFKAGKTEILAGQTYYPLTADFPDTLNDYYLGHSGMLWSRAPMLRATYSAASDVKLTAAVVRPTSKLTDAEGTHSALPGFQGKVEKGFGKARVSLAGALGVWKSTITQNTADISALVAAFYVPLAPFTLTGEVWTGRNMADFLGGLGNTGYGARGVASRGGFLSLKYKPEDTLWLSAGYGVDDPDNARVALNGRTKNTTAFANAVKRLYGCVDTGFEVSELVTQYKRAAGLYSRSSMNYQLTLKLLF